MIPYRDKGCGGEPIRTTIVLVLPPPYREWRGGRTSATRSLRPYGYFAAPGGCWRNFNHPPPSRWLRLAREHTAAFTTNPMDQRSMNHSLLKARAVLASLPRCTATSRQTGKPCKLPGTGAGGKCRFHGGASTGRPPTHGRNTKRARLNRDWLRLLLGLCAIHEGVPNRMFKPGRLKPERVAELLAAHLRRGGER